MLKIYDKKGVYQEAIQSLNIEVSEELALGQRSLRAILPFSKIVQEESKLEYEGYKYVVKELNINNDEYYEIYCAADLGDLNSRNISSITGYGLSFENAIKQVLNQTSWTCRMHEPVYGAYTLRIQNQTGKEVIEALKVLYKIEVFYNTKEKVLEVWNKRQNDLNQTLQLTDFHKWERQSDTYNLVTKLYPLGKNLEQINLVNGGCPFVTNHQYTDEDIVGYYIDSGIDNADDLLKIATQKLEEISKPSISYKIYGVHYPVGSIVSMYDMVSQKVEKFRVQKWVKNSNSPEKNFIILGDERVSFAEMYKNFAQAQKILDRKLVSNIAEISKNY